LTFIVWTKQSLANFNTVIEKQMKWPASYRWVSGGSKQWEHIMVTFRFTSSSGSYAREELEHPLPWVHRL